MGRKLVGVDEELLRHSDKRAKAVSRECSWLVGETTKKKAGQQQKVNRRVVRLRSGIGAWIRA